MGEALGGSVQAMMRAAGFDNEKEFFKAVEAGQVMSDVLPKFALELKKMAREGGALDKVMEKTRAQLNRFLGDLTRAKDTIFQSGADEGLSYMFGNLSAMLKELEPATKAFGAAFKGMVSTLTASLRVLLLPLRILTDMLSAFGMEDKNSSIIWNLVGAGGGLALLAMGFNRIAVAVGLANQGLLIMMGRLALIAAPLLVVEDMVTGFNGGETALGRGGPWSAGTTIGQDWMDRYGIFWGQQKMANGETELRITFDSEEAKKFVQVNVAESNQRVMSQTAAGLGG